MREHDARHFKECIMFKFSYQKLLEFYSQQEEVARRDYMESLHKLEIEKVRLNHMYKLCDQSLDDAFQLRNSTEGAPIERLTQIDLFMDGQKIKIEKQKQIIINHTQIVEQKQEILFVAAKEKKILEKLKEKKIEEHKAELKKRDAKLNDEIVVTRFKNTRGGI